MNKRQFIREILITMQYVYFIPVFKTNTELYIFFVVFVIVLIYITVIIIGIMIYILKRKSTIFIGNYFIIILRLLLPFFSYFFFGQIFILLTSVYYCRKELLYESPYLHCLEGLWIYSLNPAARIAMVFQILIGFITNWLYYKPIFNKDCLDNLKKTDSTPDIVLMFTKIAITILFISDKGLESEHWAMLSFLVFVTGINAYFNLAYQNRHNKVLMNVSNFFCLILFLGYSSIFFGKIFRKIEFDGVVYIVVFNVIMILLFIFFIKKREIKFVNIDYKNINTSNEYLDYIYKYYQIIKNENNRNSSVILKSLISKLEEKCYDSECPLNKFLESLNKGIECKYLLFQYCDKLFQYGIAKYKDNIALKNNYSIFLIAEMNNKKKSSMILNTIENQLLYFQMNYNIFRCKELINKSKIKESNDNFTITNYIDNFHELKKIIIKVTLFRSEFLSLILRNKIKHDDNFQKIYDLSLKIKKCNKNIDKIYSKLIKAKTNNIEIINLYSEYVEKVLEDEEKFKNCHKIKKLIFSNAPNISKNSFSNFDVDILKEKNTFPYLIISSNLKNLGIIKDCSISLSKIFSYQKEELIGKHINILIPELFQKKHNIFLLEESKKNKMKFYEDLSKNKIYSPNYLEKEIYGISKSKFLIPVKLSIYFIKTEDNELAYIIEIEKKIPLIDDEDNNHLKCCVLTDENFKIQSFSSNSIHYLKLNYNHINTNYEIINNIKEFREEYLIDINATQMSKSTTIRESSIMTHKKMKKNLMLSSLVKSIKTDILNKNFLQKSKITWIIDEDFNTNKNKTRIIKKMNSMNYQNSSSFLGININLNDNTEEKELFMEVKKIIFDRELIGYYFFFSKINEDDIKKKAVYYRHSLKKPDIHKLMAKKGKTLNKIYLSQKSISHYELDENNKSKKHKLRYSVDNLDNLKFNGRLRSVDIADKKVKFEKKEKREKEKYDFIPSNFIPNNTFNFLFNLHKLCYNLTNIIEDKNIFEDILKTEAMNKIKKFQYLKYSIVYRNNKSLNKILSYMTESDECSSSYSSEHESSSKSISIENSNNMKKSHRLRNQTMNEDNKEIMENAIKEYELNGNQIKKNFFNDYYKVNINKIHFLKFDFYKEIFIEGDEIEKEPIIKKILSDTNNNEQSNGNDGLYSNIVMANMYMDNIKEKQKKKLIKKDYLINEQKILERKINKAINSKKDETQIKKLKISSFIYFITMIIMLLICIFFFLYSYKQLKGLLNLIRNAVKIKYCDNMSVFYVGESTLLNFNANKIEGGVFYNFPANQNNKEGYIYLMRKKIKELFLENESALQNLITSNMLLTKNTTNYLSKTFLNTDYIMNDGSIEIISADIFTTLMQYNGAFYNLAFSPYYLEQNHSDILNFLHNSFNDYSRGINILIELYIYELENQVIIIEAIWICLLILFFIIYVTIYSVVVHYFISTSKKRASYIEILYGIDEQILRTFISNCENFFKKMSKSHIIMTNDDEEDIKDSFEENKSFCNKQKKKYKRESISMIGDKKEITKNNNFKIKNKLPDNIFGFMKNFGFFLLISYTFYIFNALYFIRLEQDATIISKYFYKTKDFHSKLIDIFAAFRQYIFDDSILIYNMLPFDYLDTNEKSSYDILSEDAEFINQFNQKFLSGNQEVKELLNQSFCSYNYTDKFISFDDCQTTIGQILKYDFSIVAANFIEELRINKFFVRYLLSTGIIKGSLNDYDQNIWLNDPTIPKKGENDSRENIFRLDLYNNETIHAHLDLIFVNIILPYIDINRKYIIPSLSIDNKDFYLFLTTVFYGIFIFLIFFVFLLLKIRFINKYIYKTRNMLTLIPINIISSQKNIKQLLNLSAED